MSVLEDAATQSDVAVHMKPPSQLPSRFAMPLAITLGTIVFTYWTIDIVSPALPLIKEDLELSAASAGLIYSLLFLGRLVGNFPAAYMLGRFGNATTAMAGGAVLVFGTIGAATAPSGFWMTPARVVQGIGISLLINACLRAVLGLKPGRGAAMTYFAFAATLGGVLGLQSGGYLSDEVGWRSVFVLGAIIAAGITIVVAFTRSSWLPIERANGRDASVQSRVELKSGSPTAPLVLNFLVFFSYSPFVALPLYAEHEFDASPERNAWLLMVITVTHLVAAFPSGRAIRQWGAQRCLIAGMMISLSGMALVLVAPSIWWIAPPMVLYGVGQVSATSAAGDIVLHLGGQSTRSIGLVRFSSDLGLVLGPYVTGAFSDRFGYGAPFVVLPFMLATATLGAMLHVWLTARHRD